MKLSVEQPQNLVDLNRLSLDKIEALSDGGLTIGALVRNSDLAHHPIVRKNYAVLSEAILKRSDGADSQHGNYCREPPAKNALHVFPRPRDAVQQA